jgi:hypothetical protein
MDIATRFAPRLIIGATALIAGLAFAPSPASAFPGHGPYQSPQPQTYGATALTLDAATDTALTANPPSGLGLTLGLVAPASEVGGAIDFPITNPLTNALATGMIDVSASGPILNATVTRGSRCGCRRRSCRDPW